MGNLCGRNEVQRPVPIADKKLSLRNVIYSMKKSPKVLYNNKRIIGKGTSSCVYLVENKKTMQQRALKEVHKSTVDFTSRNSLSDEMMILSSLVCII
jgi:serine/threonine protein kinase